LILIVDDDPSITASLELLLRQHGVASCCASGPAEAGARLSAGGVHLVLQDMNFSRETSGREGLALLRETRRSHPAVPVVLMTAWGSIDLAVEGMKAGAADFLTKPWNNEQLLASIETVLELASMRAEEERPAPTREELDERHDFEGLVAASPKMMRILEVAARVAPTDASVLITGESGTGKEVLADAIHRNSRRKDKPFVKVNLGGISSTLFESEMFGHVRGAFTDAQSDRPGRFEVSDGGTIFLDEIGDLDLSAQVKLLRVLQDRSYEVLGSSKKRTADVRVVSATNRVLGEQVASGAFREDLLYRLNLITLELPPLRERREEIPLFAGHFLRRSAYRHGRPDLELSSGAVDWLCAQPWQGNVRELEQTIERAVLLADSEVLERESFRGLAAAAAAADASGGLPEPGAMTLKEVERALVERSLAHFEGNVSRAAMALGLSRAALYRRCEKYGIPVGGE